MNIMNMSIMKTGTFAVLVFAALLAACTPKKDRRSFGTVIDDQTVEVKVIDLLYSRPEFGDQDHIKVEAHNSTLLLAGETSSQENKALATELASQLKSVDRVVNELDVMPAADTGGRFNNSYITSKVNTKLMTSNPVEGFDAGRIKVITAHGNVYLMGTVSREEGDAVADIVRNTGGVKKVVKVFDYTD
jgi:osmotically-inducible protein OsmY